VSVRELTKDDLQLLLDLYIHLHDTDSPLPERECVESVWIEALNNKSIKYFGYYLGSSLVSSCTISVIPNLTRSCRPYGVIENVVTHGQFRRKGYGHAVISAALEFAWDRNCYKVMLMTGQLDEGTFKFYESAGFKRNKKEAFIASPNSL
jgi:GNAT superfamily N-acetyltransferase